MSICWPNETSKKKKTNQNTYNGTKYAQYLYLYIYGMMFYAPVAVCDYAYHATAVNC